MALEAWLTPLLVLWGSGYSTQHIWQAGLAEANAAHAAPPPVPPYISACPTPYLSVRDPNRICSKPEKLAPWSSQPLLP
jgi:hypothetical protein